MKRIIGTYTGLDKGPLLIVFAGMHGNEPAGVSALEHLFGMLEREPAVNPGFRFKGRLIGVRGNLQALATRQRYIKKDLNRLWTAENIKRVTSADLWELDEEEHELRELYLLVNKAIADYHPDNMVVLDLHTTTAEGGIFTIVSNDKESIRIGLGLHAPVIKGMMNGISGTCLHYFNSKNFALPTTCLAFESGQHSEKMSVARAIAALVNFLRVTEAVRPKDIEHRHDQLLKTYSKDLPDLTELVTVHRVLPEDGFEMKPGYLNFQPISAGEVLATNRTGDIYAPIDGMILMPLYQAQGNDGFFIVKEVNRLV